MILAIGIDSVEIKRFAHWPAYSRKQLQRIFSSNEITYCLKNEQKSAEKFAVRFAAREALWKALCQAWPNHTMPFLFFCRNIEIVHTKKGAPYFRCDQSIFTDKYVLLSESKINVSLTHTDEIATAIVLISNLI